MKRTAVFFAAILLLSSLPSGIYAVEQNQLAVDGASNAIH
jgi:hypothetical protein